MAATENYRKIPDGRHKEKIGNEVNGTGMYEWHAKNSECDGQRSWQVIFWCDKPIGRLWE